MKISDSRTGFSKRAYAKPELQKLGLVKELTQAGGSSRNEAANDPLCFEKPLNANSNCIDPNAT